MGQWLLFLILFHLETCQIIIQSAANRASGDPSIIFHPFCISHLIEFESKGVGRQGWSLVHGSWALTMQAGEKVIKEGSNGIAHIGWISFTIAALGNESLKTVKQLSDGGMGEQG